MTPEQGPVEPEGAEVLEDVEGLALLPHAASPAGIATSNTPTLAM
jgi:hypothetical protein